MNVLVRHISPRLSSPARLAIGSTRGAIEALAAQAAAAAALLVECLPEDRMLIFFWILLLLCALCCCAPLRYLLSNEWPRLRQLLYFPLSGQMRWEHRTQRTRLLRRLNGVEVTLTTADERVVHAVWVPAPARSPTASGPTSAPSTSPMSSGSGGRQAPAAGGGGDASGSAGPAVLLLHANAMVLGDMNEPRPSP